MGRVREGMREKILPTHAHTSKYGSRRIGASLPDRRAKEDRNSKESTKLFSSSSYALNTRSVSPLSVRSVTAKYSMRADLRISWNSSMVNPKPCAGRRRAIGTEGVGEGGLKHAL
jgi:hypothetical protein